MKLSHVALVGTVVGVCLSIYFIFKGYGLPARDTITSAQVETSVPRISANETVGTLPTRAGGNETASGVDKEFAALRGEMAHLRADFAALRQQIRAQGSMQAGTDQEGKDLDKNLRSDPVIRAEAERRHQEQMQAVETAFRREPTDQQWSPQATTGLQEALVNQKWGEQVAVQNVECRSRTCRVEIAADNAGSLDKSLPLLFMQLGETLPSAAINRIEDGNGGTTTILYLSRDRAEPPPDDGR